MWYGTKPISVGDVFTRLTVLSTAGHDKYGNLLWLCKCACGNEKIVAGYNLKRPNKTGTLSCGCLGAERASRRRKLTTKHGHTIGKPSLTYQTWGAVIARVCNPLNVGYSRYGGRGIKVCKRWLKFENFLADVGERPSGAYSLDRIDNDGNYEPGNVRWILHRHQHWNTRRNVWITVSGQTKCLAEWALIEGLPYSTAYGRYKRGTLVLTELPNDTQSSNTGVSQGV